MLVHPTLNTRLKFGIEKAYQQKYKISTFSRVELENTGRNHNSEIEPCEKLQTLKNKQIYTTIIKYLLNWQQLSRKCAMR